MDKAVLFDPETEVRIGERDAQKRLAAHCSLVLERSKSASLSNG
jgi:hypothetical protein